MTSSIRSSHNLAKTKLQACSRRAPAHRGRPVIASAHNLVISERVVSRRCPCASACLRHLRVCAAFESNCFVQEPLCACMGRCQTDTAPIKFITCCRTGHHTAASCRRYVDQSIRIGSIVKQYRTRHICFGPRNEVQNLATSSTPKNEFNYQYQPDRSGCHSQSCDVTKVSADFRYESFQIWQYQPSNCGRRQHFRDAPIQHEQNLHTQNGKNLSQSLKDQPLPRPMSLMRYSRNDRHSTSRENRHRKSGRKR